VGYISGTGGSILKSIDGGKTFFINNFLGAYIFRDICFINENEGAVAGDVNALFLTYDGGSSWTSVDVPDSMSNIERVFYISQNEFYVVGGAVTMYGKIYHTRNRGRTWKNVFTPEGSYAYDMVRLLNGKWIVPTGDGKIWYSMNKGDSWTESYIAWNGSDTTKILLGDIQMYNNFIGYACGVNRSATESFVLKTTDGGLNWVKLNIPSTPNTEKDYFFTINTMGENEVLVGGGQFLSNTSRIMYSQDAGQTWKIDSSFLHDRYIQEMVYKNGKLHGAGQQGLIFTK